MALFSWKGESKRVRREYVIRLSLIALLVVACVVVLRFFPIRQGLDLQGGANITMVADTRAEKNVLEDVRKIVLERLRKAGLEKVPVTIHDDREGFIVKVGSREAVSAVRQAIGQSVVWESETRKVNLNLSYGEPKEVTDGYEVLMTAAQEITREAMEKAKTVVDLRVNGLGLSETVVQLDQNSNRLIVQLPGVKNAAEATENLVRVARLTFRIDGKVVMDGSDLVRAEATYGGNYNAPVLKLILTKEGGKRFETITGQNVNKLMAIYLDEEMLMEASIREKISGGEPYVDFNGSRTIDQVKVYAVQMNSGALPVPLRVIASSTVGPTLGKEAIKASIVAGIIGLLLVFAFITYFYKVPGALASLALIIYAVLALGILASLRAVLTLPGIAGFILSVGMAVDGNIVIFERIKDELRTGKHMRAALEAGFSRAFVPILDSNLTTILTGAVLFFLGTGLVRGFATTLIIGVAVSMFTVLVVTRAFLGVLVDRYPDRFMRYFES